MLARLHPEVRVRSVDVLDRARCGDGIASTADRIALRVVYAPGGDAGLPSRMILKTRLLHPLLRFGLPAVLGLAKASRAAEALPGVGAGARSLLFVLVGIYQRFFPHAPDPMYAGEGRSWSVICSHPGAPGRAGETRSAPLEPRPQKEGAPMASPTRSSSPTSSTGSPPPRSLVKAFTWLHLLLHRVSGGRWLNSVGGDDVCFVTMKGARSGRTLTRPLMYVPYRDGVLLVASLGGSFRNPAWYHNLVKHPEIAVEHRGRHMELRARLATAEEKGELWPICDRHYRPYAAYRRRTSRDIPIFVCEPRG